MRKKCVFKLRHEINCDAVDILWVEKKIVDKTLIARCAVYNGCYCDECAEVIWIDFVYYESNRERMSEYEKSVVDECYMCRISNGYTKRLVW